MIHNPYIGMRVRFIDNSVGQPFIRYLRTCGTIVNVGTAGVEVKWDLDGEVMGFYSSRLDFAMTPEEIQVYQERHADQQRRKAYADKYL